VSTAGRIPQHAAGLSHSFRRQSRNATPKYRSWERVKIVKVHDTSVGMSWTPTVRSSSDTNCRPCEQGRRLPLTESDLPPGLSSGPTLDGFLRDSRQTNLTLSYQTNPTSSGRDPSQGLRHKTARGLSGVSSQLACPSLEYGRFTTPTRKLIIVKHKVCGL
jgi:hypothetical protein